MGHRQLVLRCRPSSLDLPASARRGLIWVAIQGVVSSTYLQYGLVDYILCPFWFHVLNPYIDSLELW